ncbi:MAG: 30S ribosomal protein S19e [Thermoplasmata archaeon]
MATVYDVDPDVLLHELAERLKNEDVTVPEWAKWVKTGVHREKAPSQEEWWYLRLASVFRKIYIKGPIGTSRLSDEYSGKADMGTKPYHARKGSRSIVRKCLQQLEHLGYVEHGKKGRVITPKGRSYLDKLSDELLNKK